MTEINKKALSDILANLQKEFSAKNFSRVLKLSEIAMRSYPQDVRIFRFWEKAAREEKIFEKNR